MQQKYCYHLDFGHFVFSLLIIAVSISSVYASGLKERFTSEYIDTLAKLKTLRMEGQIEFAGQSGAIEILFKEPGDLRTSIKLENFEIVQGFDGKICWLKDQNGQVSEISGLPKKQMINSAWLQGCSYLFDDRIPGEVNFLRDTVIDAVSFEIYEGLPDGGDTIELFFNPENNHVEIVVEHLDEIPVITYMSDFKNIEGVPFSFRQESKSSIPQFNTLIEFSSITGNPPIADTLFKMPGTSAIDYFFPENVDSTLVAMDYFNGHIYFKAAVNDQPPVYFILDSGAGINCLDKNYADSIGLESEGDFAAKGISGYESASISRIDSLSIGEIRLYRQGTTVIDFSALSIKVPTGGKFGGAIGYDLLSRFPMRIDYQNKQLIFYNPKSFVAPPDEYRLDFKFVMQIPMVMAEINGIKGRFLVDLGNSIGLILHDSFVEKNKLSESFAKIRKMQGRVGGIGGSSEAYAAVADYLILGPARMDSVAVMVAGGDQGLVRSEDIDGNIGNMIIERFSIIFDYPHKRMFILPIN